MNQIQTLVNVIQENKEMVESDHKAHATLKMFGRNLTRSDLEKSLSAILNNPLVKDFKVENIDKHQSPHL